MKFLLIATHIAIAAAGEESCPFTPAVDSGNFPFMVKMVGTPMFSMMMGSADPTGIANITGMEASMMDGTFGYADFLAHNTWCDANKAAIRNPAAFNMPCKFTKKKRDVNGTCVEDAMSTLFTINEWNAQCKGVQVGEGGACWTNGKCLEQSLEARQADAQKTAGMMSMMIQSTTPSTNPMDFYVSAANVPKLLPADLYKAAIQHTYCTLYPTQKNFPKAIAPASLIADLLLHPYTMIKGGIPPLKPCGEYADGSPASFAEIWNDKPVGTPSAAQIVASFVPGGTTGGTITYSHKGCNNVAAASAALRVPLAHFQVTDLTPLVRIPVNELRTKYKDGSCCAGDCLITTTDAKIAVLP